MAPQRQQRRRRDIARVRPERHSLHHVRRRADAPADNQAHPVADPLVAQPLVNRRERKLDRDTDVVADACRCRARAAAQAVDGDDVRAAAGDTAGDGRDVVHRRHLDDDGLFIPRGLLEREHQLPQVLDGVDVVVRRGRDGIAPLRNHTRARDVRADLPPGQMSADAGLRPLPHLDLDGRARVQIPLIHAEAPGGHLHHRLRPEVVKILMQAALPRVPAGSEPLRRERKALLRVIADRAVAHR